MNVLDWLSGIGPAAKSQLAFVAYIVAVVWWGYCFVRIKRHKNLLKGLENIPKAQRTSALRDELGIVEKSEGLTGEQLLKAKIHRYYFHAFVVLCFLVLALFAIRAFSLAPKNSATAEDAPTARGSSYPPRFAGTVTDSVTNAAISGAVVSIDEERSHTTTDSNGYFDLTSIDNSQGRKTISVANPGYQSLREAVLPSTQLYFSLKRKGQ